MRAPFCGFGQTNNGRGLFQLDSATSIIKFVKRRCTWIAKKKIKRQIHSHPQEKKNTGQLVTLEEWILASPDMNLSFTSAGEFQVCRETSNGNRIHPSFYGTQEGKLSQSRENYTMERSAILEEEEAQRGEAEDCPLLSISKPKWEDQEESEL